VSLPDASLPDAAELLAVLEASWPPAATSRAGPWRIREGRGGGQRVSAATAEEPVTEADIPQAEAAMRALGQRPLFMLRPGDEALDAALAARGYTSRDATNLYACPVTTLAEPPPPVSGFTLWPPLAIMEDLWAEGGIGPERLAVMHRAAPPKTGIIGRTRDRAAGTAFVAIHAGTAMIHALEVAPELRRAGTARNIMRLAALWAQDHGARHFALAVTAANAAGNALYSGLGMTHVAGYHYRVAPKTGDGKER